MEELQAACKGPGGWKTDARVEEKPAAAENGERSTRGKPKGASPTELTLKECRRRGWVVAKTEVWVPSFATNMIVEAALGRGDMAKALASHRKHGPGVRVDLFGFVDVLAVTPESILAVQATAGGGSGASNAKARVRKIAGECADAARAWLAAGGAIQVWGWTKPKHRWEVTVTEVTAEMLASRQQESPVLAAGGDEIPF